MKSAFGGFSIRTLDTLDSTYHDRAVAAVMEERGLSEFIRSDGCSYPIVVQLRDGEVREYEVLDPYTGYSTSCRAVCCQTGLSDGWQIHILGGGRSSTPPQVS